MMNPSPAGIEASQSIYLKQLLEQQRALEQLLNQQPEAARSLSALLLAKIQSGFPGLPLPIALKAVSYDEDIQLCIRPGTHTLVSTDTPARPLSALFTDTPWGGENHNAPNRHYRYHATSTYQLQPGHRVSATSGGTPAFETFLDTLIRQPDQCFQQLLDEYWRGPFAPGESTTRRQWLASQLGKTLQAEAALRVEDGTLDTACKILIGQLVERPCSQARAGLPPDQRPAAFAVRLKGRANKPDIALVEVFVIAGKTPAANVSASTDIGAVVLFTPHQGIETHASLQALDQSLRMQMAQGTAREQLLSLACWQDQARARRYLKSAPAFVYTAIDEHLFQHRVERLLRLQKADIEYAWQQARQQGSNGQQVYEQFNRLAHLGTFLDLRELMVARSRRYLEAALPAWYQAASKTHKQALKQRAHAELEANKRLAGQFRTAAIPTLHAFASSQLTQQLQRDYPDWDTVPDKVQVHITTSFNPASMGGGAGVDHVPQTDDPATRPSSAAVLTLTQLALKNNTPWDVSVYQLLIGKRTSMSAEGKATSGRPITLDDAYLKSLIKKLDVGAGYDRLLQLRLLDQGQPLRQAWSGAYLASLKTQALTARLLSGSFLKDRENRGHKWVNAIIETFLLNAYTTVSGHKVVASALIIANSPATANGYSLNDSLIISVENRRSVPNVILFTPSCPAEHDIQEFTDSAAMQQFLQLQWDTSSEWRDYVLQHLTELGKARVTERKNRIYNPFDNLYFETINAPVCDALYEQQVWTLRHNADVASTSNAEVERESLWNKVTFGIDLAIDLIGFLPITSAFNAVRNITRTLMLLKQMGRSKSAARALWSITGARSRPLLAPRFDAVPALRPTPDLSGLDVAVDPLTLERIRGNLYQSATSVQQYVRVNGKHYLTDIAQGQRFLHPEGAAGKTLRYPLTLDASLKHWQVEPKPRLPGGMVPVERSALQTTYRDYELSPADLAALPSVNQARPGSFNLEKLPPVIPVTDNCAAIFHVFGIQARLRRHARSYYRAFVAPSRSIALPPPRLSTDDLLNQLFSQRRGLIFGEHHSFPLTRQYLTRHAVSLSRAGVAAFYMEVFNTDMHQAALRLYNASPNNQLPQLLRSRIERMGEPAAGQSPFDYVRLVEAVHAQGIPIHALDTTASYLYRAGDLELPHPLTLAEYLDRVTMFNFFAYKRINFDQSSIGPHRWVALVGVGHCNTMQDIPGLAELTDAIGIRMTTRVATQPMTRVTHDPGRLIDYRAPSGRFLYRCDLQVCLRSTVNDHELALRLHSPFTFTTVMAPTNQALLLYINAQHAAVEVAVLADGSQAYVNHAPFGAVSHRRFADLDALTEALIDELGMIEV